MLRLSSVGILGPNTDYPGSTSAGYASNQSEQDRFGGNWLQMQFPEALPPGEYNVTFELDAYVDVHVPLGALGRLGISAPGGAVVAQGPARLPDGLVLELGEGRMQVPSGWQGRR